MVEIERLMSKVKGFAAEEKAKDYLVSQGLKWIESNYTIRSGEIDLVMLEDDYLVFIEVRFRSSLIFGGAAESVTYQKQKKLLNVGQHFLMTHKKYHNHPVRFDVISFDGNPFKINWIKNAFQID